MGHWGKWAAGWIGLLALVACGSARESGLSSGGDGSDPSGPSPSGAGGAFSGDGSRGAGCSEDVKNYVYVLSAERGLYRFAPDRKTFAKVGDLRCMDDPLSFPNSMAIDRSGNAWVNYITVDRSRTAVAGAIYRVNVRDASCDRASRFDLPKDWLRIGMGYSTDAKDAESETLYVASTSGSQHGLGRVDVAAKKVVPIGTFEPRNPFGALNAELTGTGDARLFGMFIEMADGSARGAPIVGRIEKASALTQSPLDMRGVEAPNAWAFSFWGGHFYLYTSPWNEPGRSSNVTDYDPTSGTVDTHYMTNVGFDIVGAGVSTCAPIAPIH